MKQAQILTPIPSTGFMYNPHMGRLKNLTCFEVFCLISIGAFSSNTALRNCFGTLFSEIPLRQELLFRNSANEGVNILAWLTSLFASKDHVNWTLSLKNLTGVFLCLHFHWPCLPWSGSNGDRKNSLVITLANAHYV